MRFENSLSEGVIFGIRVHLRFGYTAPTGTWETIAVERAKDYAVRGRNFNRWFSRIEEDFSEGVAWGWVQEFLSANRANLR